jgi:DNA replication protein DnaC
VYNRLLSGNFNLNILKFVDSLSYNLPFIEEGKNYLEYFINNALKVDKSGNSLFIYSKDRGRGKTTLTHYILFNTIRNFVNPGNYRSSRNYKFQHIEDFFEENNKKDYVDYAYKATWFVLDDLGNEDKSSPWRREAMLSYLQRMLHYRRNNRLPTIITSNYDPEGISMLYERELDSLLEIKSDYTLGGLLFRSIKVGGPEDLRLIDVEDVWEDLC